MGNLAKQWFLCQNSEFTGFSAKNREFTGFSAKTRDSWPKQGFMPKQWAKQGTQWGLKPVQSALPETQKPDVPPHHFFPSTTWASILPFSPFYSRQWCHRARVRCTRVSSAWHGRVVGYPGMVGYGVGRVLGGYRGMGPGQGAHCTPLW